MLCKTGFEALWMREGEENGIYRHSGSVVWDGVWKLLVRELSI